MEKILIIKIGFSEILDSESNSRVVSLGDVLRTTPLLHLYKNDKVTWVTDIEAFPLLEENPFIDRILPYDFTTIMQLQSEEFDTVINLEKIPGICALADRIKAWKKYGFRFHTQTGKAEAHDKAFEVLAVSSHPLYKKTNSRTAQELLFELVGKKWNNEEYVLGYKPKTLEEYDVALNTLVGKKWLTKSWPMEYLNILEEELKKEGFKVTRQDKQNEEILKSLHKYMDWINSARLILSNDSLGMHLGIAMKKKVIGLFGPTPYKEVYFYGRGKALYLNSLDCMPCFSQKCHENKNNECMKSITPENVLEEIRRQLI